MSRPFILGVPGLAAGVALLAWVPTVAAQSDRAHRQPAPEVRSLVFKGVKHVDPRDLQKSIYTQASNCKNLLLYPFCLISHSGTFMDRHYLNHDELARDVLRIRVFYWLRGYRDATVDTTISPQGPGVKVVIAVHENAPTTIARLTILYDTTLVSNRRRQALTLLHAKDPLDLVLLDSMRVLWLQEMWDVGHSDAVIDTATQVDTVTRLGDVDMRVIPKWTTRVGQVRITGNEKVSERTIRNSLTFREGDIYRRKDVLQSQRNLYESNLFRLATIPPPKGDSIKAIDVQVIEAPMHATSVGGGFNTVDFAQLQSTYTNYNMFGGARRLDVTASAGNLLAPTLNGSGVFYNSLQDIPASDRRLFLQPTWAASIDFKQPAFLQRPADAMGVGIFAHRREAPGIYVDRGYGATATYTHTLNPRAPLSLNYRYEIARVEASDVYFCADYGVCDTLTIGSLRSHQSLSPLLFTGFVDQTDDPFEPTQGYVAHVDLEHASSLTLSDYRYNRGVFDGAMYFGFGRKKSLVLATHLQLGIVRPMAGGRTDIGVLHPSKRFYAGGSRSVRGYGENQLGPRILTIDEQSLRVDSVVGGRDTVYRCAPSVPVQNCDPNAHGLTNGDFQPRPLGGMSLVLGTVELRFPLWAQYNLEGAVFIDGATVGESALQSVTDLRQIAKGTGAITPGFGFRYRSPVGPIRVDLGYAPTIAEDLNVVTATVVNGQKRIVPLATPRRYTQGTGGLLNRLVLHFSIGEAF